MQTGDCSANCLHPVATGTNVHAGCDAEHLNKNVVLFYLLLSLNTECVCHVFWSARQLRKHKEPSIKSQAELHSDRSLCYRSGWVLRVFNSFKPFDNTTMLGYVFMLGPDLLKSVSHCWYITANRTWTRTLIILVWWYWSQMIFNQYNSVPFHLAKS